MSVSRRRFFLVALVVVCSILGSVILARAEGIRWTTLPDGKVAPASIEGVPVFYPVSSSPGGCTGGCVGSTPVVIVENAPAMIPAMVPATVPAGGCTGCTGGSPSVPQGTVVLVPVSRPVREGPLRRLFR